jgi:hypothetical protein
MRSIRKILLLNVSVFLVGGTALFFGMWLGLGEILPNVIISWMIYLLLSSGAIWIIFHFRRRWREILLGFVAILISLILAELLIRVLLPEFRMVRFPSMGVASERYHHIYPPDKSMYLGRVDGRILKLKTNSDGLSSAWSPSGFKAHGCRIVAMGDSYTFGLGVPQDSAWPQQLEREIFNRCANSDVAVLNAGIVSYSPFLANLLFSGMVQDYKPDLLLYLLDATDFRDDHYYAHLAIRSGDQIRFPLSAGKQIRYFGALFELLRPYFRSYLRYPFDAIAHLKNVRYRFQVEMNGKTEDNPYFIFKYPPAETRPYFMETLKNIQSLSNRAKENGSGFVLVLNPRYQLWDREACPENWEKNLYSPDEPFTDAYIRFFEEMKDSVDFPILNLLPYFRSAADREFVFEGDAHWTEKGHKRVANVVADYLFAPASPDCTICPNPQPE